MAIARPSGRTYYVLPKPRSLPTPADRAQARFDVPDLEADGGGLMSLTTLNLPTEIPWERICVTADMIARDLRNPPGKWRSSIAVFTYVPEDDYQMYPGREISYLKLVVTVCGYQARDKEVEGSISWGSLTTTDRENIEELLSHYHPCTGALVQLAVTPSRGAEGMQSDDFPYLMDFQPKKRELY